MIAVKYKALNYHWTV